MNVCTSWLAASVRAAAFWQSTGLCDIPLPCSTCRSPQVIEYVCVHQENSSPQSQLYFVFSVYLCFLCSFGSCSNLCQAIIFATSCHYLTARHFTSYGYWAPLFCSCFLHCFLVRTKGKTYSPFIKLILYFPSCYYLIQKVANCSLHRRS